MTGLPDEELMELLADTRLRTVTLDKFVSIDEAGADAILGDADSALMPGGGDAMVYGDGGVGKTTLVIDLAFHLAAGDDWLGITIARPVRVLIIENEGPRPLFRKKLKRKRDGWTGSPVGDRLHVFEHPWGRFTFASEEWRQLLADEVRGREVDVVVAGPITSSGMDAAGTIQEVRDFLDLVGQVRVLSGRPIVVLLIHHENRGGKVSGAWEGVGDTLLHVTQQSHGHLRLYVQKARWSSEQHATTLKLVWADGDGFALADDEPSRPERVWDGIAEYVHANGGCAWNVVEREVSGQGDYLRRRRDAMLEDGLIINVGRGQAFELWHRDDPARPTLYATTVSEGGHGSDTAASASGDAPERTTVSPCPVRSRDTGGDAVGSASPADPTSDDGAVGDTRSISRSTDAAEGGRKEDA